MTFKAAARSAVLVLVATVALGACSSDSETTSSAAGGECGGGDRTLNLPVVTPPADFRIGAWSGGEAALFLSVYDTLVTISPEGDIEPSIAESWQFNDDNTELTFTIREGMTFTDGAPVDAAAVVASLEASRKGASTSGTLTSVKQVTAPDDSTVVLTLAAPNAGMLAQLSNIAGAVGSPKVLTAVSSQLSPVGSGPYVLDKASIVVGSSYTMNRNPDHWNVDAYPYSKVGFKVLQDPTALQNALRSGQIDFAGVQPEQAAAFDKNQFTVGDNTLQAVAALYLVDREGKLIPALRDVRVRKAINLALDRESIAKSLGAGALTPTNQVVDPRGDAYSEELLEETAFDLEEAKKLMADAGFADGFSVTMPSVAGLTTTYESVLEQQLGEIGIKIKYEALPFQDFQTKVFTGKYGMFFFYNGFGGSDAADVAANTSTIFNPFQHTTPEFQKLVAEANAAPEDEQDEAFRKVNEYFVEQAWFAPINYSKGLYVAAKDVEFTAPYQTSRDVRPFTPVCD